MTLPIPATPPRSAPVLENSTKFQQKWYGWFQKIGLLFGDGYTGTITTAKLTGAGVNGSMTFVSGVLVSQTPAT